MSEPRRRLAIIGAGPTGLEAALAAVEAGIDFTVYESARRAAGHVRAWGHVRLFTPWSMNASPTARRVLTEAGGVVPDDVHCPTGHELADTVLDAIAALPEIAPHVRYETRVREISRDGLLKSDEIGTPGRSSVPFRLLLESSEGERVEHADIVMDCSGTYGKATATGGGGIRAPGERAAADRIERFLPALLGPSGEAPGAGAEEWLGRRILLVGAGHSAQTAARDLARLVELDPTTRVTWVVRAAEPDFGIVEDDPLPERAALGVAAMRLVADASPLDVRLGTTVESFEPTDEAVRVVLRREGSVEQLPFDRVLSLTGSVGDASLYRQLQVHECWATTGPMRLAAALLSSSSADCLAETSHGAETLVNPEPGFFILGDKSYGRNTNFLMRVGWEQVEDVFSLITDESST